MFGWRKRMRTKVAGRVFTALVEQAVIALDDGSMFQVKIKGELACLDVDRFVLDVERRAGFPVRGSADISEGLVTIYRDDVEVVDYSMVVAEVVKTAG